MNKDGYADDKQLRYVPPFVVVKPTLLTGSMYSHGQK